MSRVTTSKCTVLLSEAGWTLDAEHWTLGSALAAGVCHARRACGTAPTAPLAEQASCTLRLVGDVAWGWDGSALAAGLCHARALGTTPTGSRGELLSFTFFLFGAGAWDTHDS